MIASYLEVVQAIFVTTILAGLAFVVFTACIVASASMTKWYFSNEE